MKILKRFNKFLLLMALVCLSGIVPVLGQSLIGNFGISNQDQQGRSVYVSIGETAIQTQISGDLLVTQGFQQPNDKFYSSLFERPSFQNIDVRLFPNPTSEYIQISGSANEFDEMNFAIVDVLGKTFITKSISKSINEEFSLTLDLAFLQSGTYFVSITNPNLGLLKSIIFEKQ